MPIPVDAPVTTTAAGACFASRTAKSCVISGVCVDGLTDLIRHYKLGMEVTQLVNLVANALVIEEKVAVPVEEAVPVEAAVADEHEREVAGGDGEVR